MAARAFVESRDLNPRRALLYLHSIADTDELRNDPETDLFITALMCNEYQVLNLHDEMLRSMFSTWIRPASTKTGYAKRSLCYTWGIRTVGTEHMKKGCSTFVLHRIFYGLRPGTRR